MNKFAIIISGQARTLNRSFLNYLDKLNINYELKQFRVENLNI